MGQKCYSLVSEELWNYKEGREQILKYPRNLFFTFLSQKYIKIPFNVIKNVRCDSAEVKSADFANM